MRLSLPQYIWTASPAVKGNEQSDCPSTRSSSLRKGAMLEIVAAFGLLYKVNNPPHNSCSKHNDLLLAVFGFQGGCSISRSPQSCHNKESSLREGIWKRTIGAKEETPGPPHSPGFSAPFRTPSYFPSPCCNATSFLPHLQATHKTPQNTKTHHFVVAFHLAANPFSFVLITGGK